MASDCGIAIFFALGIGFLIGYLIASIGRAMRRARPRRSRPRDRSRTRRNLRRPTASGTTGACVLRLDASGLTADGKPIDIAGAVARCKVTGQVELTVASDDLAHAYIALIRALAGAGVAVTIKRPTEE